MDKREINESIIEQSKQIIEKKTLVTEGQENNLSLKMSQRF